MYLQIIEQIRHRIAIGDWQAGQELPSIRALAAAVHVSVISGKRAYLELERDGVMVTRQGKGSFVGDRADSACNSSTSSSTIIFSRRRRGYALGMTRDELAARRREPFDTQGTPPTSGETDDNEHDRVVIDLEGVEKGYRFFQLSTSACGSTPDRSWGSSAPTARASPRRFGS